MGGRFKVLSNNGYEGSTCGYFDYSGVDMGSNTTLISVGSNDVQGGGVADYICYAWREIADVSKFGTYNGNGSVASGASGGQVINIGFLPRFLLIKRRNGSAHWVIYDTFRSGAKVNDDSLLPYLAPNNNEAESSSNDGIDLYESGSTKGIRLMTADNYTNQSGGIYIYAAFA